VGLLRQTMLMRQWAALVPHSGPTAITPTTRQQMVAAIHLAESVAPWASTSGKLVLACFDPQWPNFEFRSGLLESEDHSKIIAVVRPSHHRKNGGLVDWSKCDAFCFGLRPFDRPLCFCQRRKGASLQTATCHRSSQPKCGPTLSAGPPRPDP